MPEFVAIVGSPGSGKDRLATQLKQALGRHATTLSLNDFVKEGMAAHEPAAIDWSALDIALGALRENQPTEAPKIDPKTGERTAIIAKPAPVIIVEGAWLLHLDVLRDLFALAIFIHCPADVCLQRLIDREPKGSSRTPEDIRDHFHEVIEPVIQRYIMPQAGHADRIITSPPTAMDIEAITGDCRKLVRA